MNRRYICTDSEGGEAIIHATSVKRAAQIFAETGDWPESNSTFWVKVNVKGRKEEDVIKVPIHPEVPLCNKEEHEWIDVEFWSSSGGIKYKEKCINCNLYKITDTWAQDCMDGEQGLHSITYEYTTL